MNTELGNIKDHYKSMESLASRFEDGPTAITSPLESEHAIPAKENSSTEHSKSRLNGSTQNHEKEEIVVRKESLADWGVVACVFLSNCISTIDFTGIGVFYPYLVEHFDATTAAVGWCSSISGFSQAVVALFASYPIKSYGCRLPGVVGCLLFALGLSLSYFAQNLTTIYFTYGVIAALLFLGSGRGLALLSTGIIIHQRFNRNRNLASGIGYLGGSLGGIIGSIVTNQLIQAYSWRGAFLILGAFQAQRVPLCLFFRTPMELTSHSNHASGTRHRRLSGQMILIYLKETFNFSILCHARYSTYSIAYFLHVFCFMGYAHHTVNRAIHVGLSTDQAVASASLYSIMSMVTRLFVSFFSNLPKVKSSLVFATGMFVEFLSVVVIFINPGIVGTMTSVVLFGIHFGCTTSVSPIVAVDLMGVDLLPRSLAILQFIGGFASLVSPPLVGWIFDVTLDYNKAFAVIGGMAFVSGSLMVALTFVTRCHQKSISEIPVSDKDLPNPQVAPEGQT